MKYKKVYIPTYLNVIIVKIPINENIGIESAIYFNCGYSYHTLFCPIEKGKYPCYICRMNDLEESMYKIKPISKITTTPPTQEI